MMKLAVLSLLTTSANSFAGARVDPSFRVSVSYYCKIHHKRKLSLFFSPIQLTTSSLMSPEILALLGSGLIRGWKILPA
jgi:hypothetical protein